MNKGQTIFSQVMDVMPLKTFHRCVARYDGDFSVKHFTCLEQFRVTAFGQLTYRESLRDAAATAILDRLAMNGTFLTMEGRSYRSKK